MTFSINRVSCNNETAARRIARDGADRLIELATRLRPDDDPLLRAEGALAQQPALKSGALAGATDSFAASGPAAAPALDIFVGDPAGGRPLAAPGKTRTAEARALLARTLGLAFRLAGRSGLKVADLAAGSLRRRWM